MTKTGVDSTDFRLRRAEIDGVLLDMDGVAASTARLHEAAWKATFDPFLRRHAGGHVASFRHDDYRRHVDGKPRLAGVRDFLAARGVALPEGDADAPGRDTVRGLAAEKTRRFKDLLKVQAAEPEPGVVRLLDRCRAAGVRTGLFTASKNAARVLEASGLLHAFDARVDGWDAAAAGLRGKPAPDVPLACARALGVAPGRCVLFEDAPAGIEAGRAGGFGLVIGVAAGDDARYLLEAGAHAVVADLSHVALADG